MKSVTKISSWKDQLDLFIEDLDVAIALNVIDVPPVIYERFMTHYNSGYLTRFGAINYNGYSNNTPTVINRSDTIVTKSSLFLWRKFPNNMYVKYPLENKTLRDSFQNLLVIGYTDIEDKMFNVFEFYFSWILINTPKNILYKHCRVLT
jgi:hypothetical protein